MNSLARPLPMTMILYFAALGTVVGAMYVSASVLAPAVQARFLQNHDRPQSRMDVLIANAREVRQALATPIAPVAPLPPISAKPLRDVAAKPVHKVPRTKLSAQARDAFASFDRYSGSQSGQMSMAFDRYRPQ